MAHVDDELLQALKDSEEQAATEPMVAPVQSRPEGVRKPASKGNLGLLLGLLVAAGGVLTLVLNNVDDSAAYSKTVSEFFRDKERLKDRTVNLKGMLVKGTLVSNLATRGKEPCEYRFVLYEKDGPKLPVRFGGCVIPDTFRDLPEMDVEVTATGKLSPEGYFAADHIMAKCPSKYEMKQRQAAGEKAPHKGAAPELFPSVGPLDNMDTHKKSPLVVSGSGKEG
ncbi:MAG: cytochrome c maturation protein CcmE [Polyangiaceae bacterium]|nr:cytochrome c maturation protein CcmE [Polyangiaceae bacterium]